MKTFYLMKKYILIILNFIIVLALDYVNTKIYKGVLLSDIYLVPLILLVIAAFYIKNFKDRGFKIYTGINFIVILVFIINIYIKLPTYTYQDAQKALKANISKEKNILLENVIAYPPKNIGPAFAIYNPYEKNKLIDKEYLIYISEGNKEIDCYIFNPINGEYEIYPLKNFYKKNL
ncbi:hypothetical protein KQI42_12625 [Tissierella sp. MSJ-40]|uniref:Uncharacterized protein n=1 Tax=Tissierella simiarum TaxID=2841534 RepID=A0ABS6E9H8_9FIRM|nr:hypothetical protein [Tissierella simiarum]MBU5438864.1 hypothetical protein [Tissierella simiarum]